MTHTARPHYFHGMPAPVLHPPKHCPDLATLWFRYFEEARVRLARYQHDDHLSTNQAAYAMGMRPGTLFTLAKIDRQSSDPKRRIGPMSHAPANVEDTTFRPARTYLVSDLTAWINECADKRRTIYGEAIIFGNAKTHAGRKRQYGNLAKMVHLSDRNITRAEKIAGRFLLRIGADLTDAIADQITVKVAKKLAEQAAEEGAARDRDMEITDAPLDNGFTKPVDNVPDPAWPLSDPRATGRSISRAQFRLALKALGMTPSQFAEFWGVSTTAAYSYNNGDLPVPLAVADYLRMKVGAFVRLRCAELGLPVPTTALEAVEDPPTTKGEIDAVDTLRAMVAERNPEGAGHDAVIKYRKNRKRGTYAARQPRRTPAPVNPAPDVPERVE